MFDIGFDIHAECLIRMLSDLLKQTLAVLTKQHIKVVMLI